MPQLPHIVPVASLSNDPAFLVVGVRLVDDRAVTYGLPDEVDASGLDLAALTEAAKPRTAVGTVTPLGRLGTGTRVFAVGLGSDTLDGEVLRRAAGSALRTICSYLADEAGATVAVALYEDAVALPMSRSEALRAVAEGSLLGAYAPTRILKEDEPGARIATIQVLDLDVEAHQQALDHAVAVAGAVARARDWVNEPANLLYPASFAESVQASFEGLPVQVDVRDEQQLADEGFHGILAVGNGSSRKPRLVRAAYSPEGAGQTLVLVGKGMTFDSGGLDIKPANGMATMKCDMGGAAAVMAATRAIAELGLRVNVVAYAPMAENMPSGSAYRSSDVLTMYDGTTVEVGNTDAEGRLVLADALALSRSDAPHLVVDVATLTGACMRALGLNTIGLAASGNDVAARVLHAAETAGEQMWQLPLTDEVRDKLKSPIADLSSTGSDPNQGMQVAAAFLQHFAGEGQNWAHLDIAGPAWRDGDASGYQSKGGTGSGVRTLVDLAFTME